MGDHPWHDGPVPNMVIGRRIEHWRKTGDDAWVQVIGPLCEVGGEPGMIPDQVEHMEFHDAPPPHPSEADQRWRILS